jgi:hypothetical protein
MHHWKLALMVVVKHLSLLQLLRNSVASMSGVTAAGMHHAADGPDVWLQGALSQAQPRPSYSGEQGNLSQRSSAPQLNLPRSRPMPQAWMATTDLVDKQTRLFIFTDPDRRVPEALAIYQRLGVLSEQLYGPLYLLLKIVHIYGPESEHPWLPDSFVGREICVPALADHAFRLPDRPLSALPAAEQQQQEGQQQQQPEDGAVASSQQHGLLSQTTQPLPPGMAAPEMSASQRSDAGTVAAAPATPSTAGRLPSVVGAVQQSPTVATSPQATAYAAE